MRQVCVLSGPLAWCRDAIWLFLGDKYWGSESKTLHPHSSMGKQHLQKPFLSSGKMGSRGLKTHLTHSLALKQNIHSYTLTTQTKGFYAPHNPRLQRRLSYCSGPNPAIEMHVGTDLKCGRFHKTKSLTVAPGCKFGLKPFICHHWINRTKSTKILVSRCPESWHLRVNSSHASYPKQEFFLEHCQTITAWPLPMTETSFFIKKKKKKIYSRWFLI